MRASAIFALLLFAGMTPIAQAYTFAVDVFACSGTQTASFGEIIAVDCTGDLMMERGTIRADERIFLHAAGNMSFLDVILDAPLIELSADSITLFSDGGMTGGEIVLGGGGISLGGGSTPGGSTGGGGGGILLGGGGISLGGGSTPGGGIVLGGGSPQPVPEPQVWGLLVVGLGLLALRRNAEIG